MVFVAKWLNVAPAIAFGAAELPRSGCGKEMRSDRFLNGAGWRLGEFDIIDLL